MGRREETAVQEGTPTSTAQCWAMWGDPYWAVADPSPGVMSRKLGSLLGCSHTVQEGTQGPCCITDCVTDCDSPRRTGQGRGWNVHPLGSGSKETPHLTATLP